jgi:hypothetical protein
MSGETERRKSYVSRSVMFPVHIVCWILPGTRSFLNLAGREGARLGICKSPITRVRTILGRKDFYQNRSWEIGKVRLLSLSLSFSGSTGSSR